MTATLATASTFMSEISCVTISQPNLMGFRLTPEIDQDLGNRLSYHFSRQFPDFVVTFYNKTFWVLGKPLKEKPNEKSWKEALNNIQQQVEDFKSYYWSFQWLHQPSPTPQVLSQLACAILKTHRPFSLNKVTENQGVEVNRIVEFWAETIEIQGELKPAFALTINSKIFYKGHLADFFQNHPFRNKPEDLLIGLQVQDIERGSTGTIVQLSGTVGEHREKLLKDATGATSKLALTEAPENQPLVSVRFGKNKTLYTYAMAALCPSISQKTADRFGVDWGKLLKFTKISYQERKNSLINNKEKAKILLKTYGFQVADKAINNRQNSDLFLLPSVSLEETLLLFGKGFKGIQGEILKGLDQRKGGGVYRRHKDYQNSSTEIKITILRLCEMKVGKFVDEVQNYLKKYGFNSVVVNAVPLSVENSNNSDSRAEVEKKVNELLATPTDIFLVFLPESDREADYTEEGSFYHQIYSYLLNRRMASQFIYDDTLKNVEYKYILYQIIPGILAKLGNLPFILAEPLEIADCFIGLDIARKPKADLPGTLNACASIRIYGKQGDFIRYRLEGDLIEGEEIPQRFLEKILPTNILEGKTVLIYRDGRFVNREIENLLARAKAINAKFILVECRKTQIPRLYNIESSKLTAPTQGLALKLSSYEAILITTKVSENMGLARPLRLNILSEGHPATIESIIDTTLKLTLLHHGALKSPRLPMPLYGSDRMAELRLKGIYPSVLEGDRQFWL
ncbi:stem cell self-renewal protein Piwi [Aphanothece hegewaldii CCALA 016]|uniref:Protein argonaute n=1 Tax=Aphanothece hegewaldii CCALA 016 TaxID=2107694 RepID=A0A2T1LS63_9CHRO|nr:Piwi domain-containing protein [Aphanothece hegewaldii]PSF32097.1 stem cell self-renewal protein Piwi [Aphanothece hegewaldii CCALA 016]